MKKLLCLVLALAMLMGMAAAASAEEDVVITFQTWNPGESDYLDKIIAGFEEANPGIKIEFNFMPYTDHIADMQIKMNNGEGADVYGMQTGATYNEFRQFEEDLTPYANASWGEGWQSKFLDFCMGLLDEDGAYYGLPLGLTYAGFIWADVEKLSQYGLTVPTNYEELLNAAKVLRENGEYPLTIGAKDTWINIDTWMSIAGDINAEKLYSAIEGETPFTDADLVESFNIWQKLFTDGIFQDGAVGVGVYSDTSDLFEKEGSVPMIMNGSWACGTFVSSDPQTYEVFNHEGADHDCFLVDWNGDGKIAGCTASIDVVLCMNTNSQHKEEAWKFIDYMLHTGQDILINEALQYCPSRTDLELNVTGLSEDGSACLQYICDQAASNTKGYREMAYPELKQAISEMLTALATGETTPEEAGAYVETASQAQAR